MDYLNIKIGYVKSKQLYLLIYYGITNESSDKNSRKENLIKSKVRCIIGAEFTYRELKLKSKNLHKWDTILIIN